MSRHAKPPIELNDILRRYLEDIEFSHTERMENKTIEPFEMFLVHTLLEEESYTENLEEIFVNFKEYMTNNKILSFPTLLSFSKKYKFNWKDEDVMETRYTDRHHSVNFLKFFPVKVTNFDKLQEFRKKYGRVAKVKTTKEVYIEKTEYKNKKLKKGKSNVHDFNTGKNTQEKTKRIVVFERLWKNHRHEIKGTLKPTKKGNVESFENFMIMTKRLSREGLKNKKKVKYEKNWIRDMITKIRKDNNIPVYLSCGERIGVLLTVKD